VSDPEVAVLSFLVVFRRFWQALRRSWEDPQFRGLLYLTALLLLAGMFFYHRVEHWTLVDALYFSVLTLTTVGYGDFYPHTAAGRVFTIIYVIVGLGIVLALLAEIATGAVAAHTERSRRRKSRGSAAEPSAG
jgi:voltage-gated potassium channel